MLVLENYKMSWGSFNLRDRLCRRRYFEISRQKIYIKLQSSQVANIVQAFRNRVWEIQKLCKIPEAASDLDWRIEASSAIHLLLSENGRFRAHFVVNLEQIEVNIFPLFTPLPNFLLLLSQTAHGNLGALTYYFYYFFKMIFMKITSKH